MTLPAGVKATSGGTFDRDATLTYFVAGNTDKLQTTAHPNVLIAVNELRSANDLVVLDKLCDQKKVLLDSGIFNLAMGHAMAHGTHMDVALGLPPDEIDGFTELWDRYGTIVQRFKDRLWGVIELDQGGIANKPITRARIEAEFGIVPMPVYHPLLDGWDYYDDLAKGYDRICFGNIVKAAPPVRLRLIHAASERARLYPYLWTHLLGVYPNENLVALPLRGSCDSSSWLTSLRWMPSWKVWSMAKMIGSFPPAMWYIDAYKSHPDLFPGGFNEVYEKSLGINSNTAQALQLTIDAMQEDTHPWLAPSP